MAGRSVRLTDHQTAQLGEILIIKLVWEEIIGFLLSISHASDSELTDCVSSFKRTRCLGGSLTESYSGMKLGIVETVSFVVSPASNTTVSQDVSASEISWSSGTCWSAPGTCQVSRRTGITLGLVVLNTL